MSGWFSRLLDAVFPYIPKCVGCGVEKGAQGSICDKCAADLDALCAGWVQASALPAYSLYWYDGIAARIVRGYKYSDKRWLSIFMGDRMAQAVRGMGHFDAVCHVPLHEKRRKSRGFDQAELLAQHIAQALGVPFIAGASRTRNTRTQTKLNREQRRENMQDAFIPNAHLFGRVLLIDDVFKPPAQPRLLARRRCFRRARRASPCLRSHVRRRKREGLRTGDRNCARCV